MRIDTSDEGDERPDAADAPTVRGADGRRDAVPDRGAALDRGVAQDQSAPPERGASPGRGTAAEWQGAGQGDDASAARVARNLEHRATVDAVFRAHAIDQGYARVKEIEEKTVTPAMRRIEAEDPDRHLAGLEHRLKGKDRLTEKVAEAMTERARTPDQAFASVKDAIRYTFCYLDDRYAEGVRADCDRLERADFEPVERRNSWGNDEYKGINSRWRVPGTSQLFEVQFHTQASFEAKQETHWAYEKLRDPATAKAEQEALSAYQREVTARIPIPPAATEIPDYRYP